MDEFILFLVLLAIPLEVLHNLRFLVSCQEGVRSMPPTELKKPFPLRPAWEKKVIHVQLCTS